MGGTRSHKREVISNLTFLLLQTRVFSFLNEKSEILVKENPSKMASYLSK